MTAQVPFCRGLVLMGEAQKLSYEIRNHGEVWFLGLYESEALLLLCACMYDPIIGQ
jgi:hypothetical protein